MEKLEQIIATYQQIIQKAELELQSARKRIYYISLLRLVLFVGAITGAVTFWADGWLYISVFAILPFILFVWLVKRHNFWFHRKDFLKKKIVINEQELRAIQYDFSDFEDGEEYIDSGHLYTFDLDVFGEHSLFQYINRTSTPVGKQHLADWFNSHLENKEAIEQRQEAIRELSTELEYRQQIRLLGLLYKGKPADTTEIKTWADSPSYYRKHTLLRIIPITVSIINLVCISLAFSGILPASAAGGVFISFVIFSSVFSKGITKLQTTYGKKLQILSTYADQILLTEKKEMHSPILQQLKAELTSQNQTASQAVRQLSKLMNALDQRSNLLMSTILNGLIFWELRQVMRIEQWKDTHAKDLPRWIETIGEIDAYCSLATFAYNHPEYIYPKICSQSFHLQAKGLGHPLMDRNKCVRNGIDIDKRPFFIIITGANMAGKSTYLRTVGVNYLLACIGAPVWADQMEIYPARLVTSLRTSDSLTDNESYFFAELKRLKLIIDKLEAGEELFIILDEILKGTNSMDKQKGSFALIKQFMNMNANGIIATHDLLLGTLIDSFPQNIRNYCFEADITNNELTFSYRMRDGVAQNMNACFLMKKMGIAVIDD
ncbi:MutS family DNA mismatch repair protein [uncultured Bacteroides sp.]|jgi:DNA mismatch repair ATPase MutS|uniref:MutS family DNA mismatch repair protein n=1 Tax=uncultured Bacteroides sp. TaxID=162156 RepID=UPI00033E1FC9|nr:MutS family DNA mismatch repair protein [uncultured Bacteroides sp.]CDA83421.1 dNA mismatch repair protein MutS [Bacteroides sp. CAG:754]